MKRILVFLVFLCFHFAGSALAPPDSVEQRLAELKGEKRLEYLISVAKEGTSQPPVKTVRYASMAFSLAGELNRPEQQADAACLLANGYLLSGKPDSALPFARQGKILYEKRKNRHGVLKASNLEGLVALHREDLATAEKMFSQTFSECTDALGGHPDDETMKDLATEVFNNLMITYVKQGNYKLAREKLLQLNREVGNRKTFTAMITAGNLGTVYQMLGRYDSSLVFTFRSLEISQYLKDDLNTGKIYSDIGNTYYAMGRYREAADYYGMAIEIFIAKNDRQRLSKTYNNLASVYKQVNFYEKATYYFIESLKLKEELHDSAGLAATYNNLGLVYSAWNNLTLARQYFLAASGINAARKSRKALSVNFNGLGDLYFEHGQADSALLYYTKSLDLKTAIGYKPGIVLSLQGIGKVYILKGDDKTAAVYLLQAMALAEETRAEHEIASLNLALGEMALRENNLAGARQMIAKTLAYAEQEEVLELMRESLQDLTEISIKAGDKGAAADYFARYMKAGDSLFSQLRTRTVMEMQTRYETEKKEREIRQLEEENRHHESQILYLVIILVILVILGFVILYLLRQKSRAYRHIVRSNLEVVEEQKRLAAEAYGKADKITEAGTSSYEEISNTTLGLLVKLTRLMEEEKPYLEPGITIEDLCRKLNTNRTYLSQIINANFNQNFNTFINTFRIREARRLLADSAQDHISIEGIGSMAGFTSKVTFHSAFKQQVGVTPSFFRKSAAGMQAA